MLLAVVMKWKEEKENKQEAMKAQLQSDPAPNQPPQVLPRPSVTPPGKPDRGEIRSSIDSLTEKFDRLALRYETTINELKSSRMGGRSKLQCYNCKEFGHGVPQCSQPLDLARVEENRKAMEAKKLEVAKDRKGMIALNPKAPQSPFPFGNPMILVGNAPKRARVDIEDLLNHNLADEVEV